MLSTISATKVKLSFFSELGIFDDEDSIAQVYRNFINGDNENIVQKNEAYDKKSEDKSQDFMRMFLSK